MAWRLLGQLACARVSLLDILRPFGDRLCRSDTHSIPFNRTSLVQQDGLRHRGVGMLTVSRSEHVIMSSP